MRSCVVTLHYRGGSEAVLDWCILLCNGMNIADIMDTSLFKKEMHSRDITILATVVVVLLLLACFRLPNYSSVKISHNNEILHLNF